MPTVKPKAGLGRSLLLTSEFYDQQMDEYRRQGENSDYPSVTPLCKSLVTLTNDPILLQVWDDLNTAPDNAQLPSGNNSRAALYANEIDELKRRLDASYVKSKSGKIEDYLNLLQNSSYDCQSLIALSQPFVAEGMNREVRFYATLLQTLVNTRLSTVGDLQGELEVVFNDYIAGTKYIWGRDLQGGSIIDKVNYRAIGLIQKQNNVPEEEQYTARIERYEALLTRLIKNKTGTSQKQAAELASVYSTIGHQNALGHGLFNIFTPGMMANAFERGVTLIPPRNDTKIFIHDDNIETVFTEEYLSASTTEAQKVLAQREKIPAIAKSKTSHKLFVLPEVEKSYADSGMFANWKHKLETKFTPLRHTVGNNVKLRDIMPNGFNLPQTKFSKTKSLGVKMRQRIPGVGATQADAVQNYISTFAPQDETPERFDNRIHFTEALIGAQLSRSDEYGPNEYYCITEWSLLDMTNDEILNTLLTVDLDDESKFILNHEISDFLREYDFDKYCDYTEKMLAQMCSNPESAMEPMSSDDWYHLLSVQAPHFPPKDPATADKDYCDECAAIYQEMPANERQNLLTTAQPLAEQNVLPKYFDLELRVCSENGESYDNWEQAIRDLCHENLIKASDKSVLSDEELLSDEQDATPPSPKST